MDEESGFSWGDLASGTLDTIGKLLVMDSAREQSRLDNRLAETRLQAELFGIPYRPMNAQANGQSYMAGIQGNQWLTPVLLLAGAFLIYQAAK